jgi:hypothetical protein
MKIATKVRVILMTMVNGGILFAAATCAADPLFYAVAGGNEFGTLDPLTGNFSYISTLATQGGVIAGIGFAADGNLYGLDVYGPSGDFLLKININDGSVTQHSLGIGGNGFGMTGSPNGTLFAYGLKNLNSSTTLYTVNPSTATTIPIGNMSNGFGGGFAFDTAGDLYITRGYFTEQLYSVNPTTAAITLVGTTGTPDAFAMAFDNNTLYMTDMNGGIWTVNTATGASTQISTYNKSLYGSIDGLASPDLLAVPEPSTLTLAGLGGLALLAYGRKRCCRLEN